MKKTLWMLTLIVAMMMVFSFGALATEKSTAADAVASENTTPGAGWVEEHYYGEKGIDENGKRFRWLYKWQTKEWYRDYSTGTITGSDDGAANPGGGDWTQDSGVGDLPVFGEVRKSHWYYIYMNELVNVDKIMKGYEDGNYYPNRTITRGEFVTLLGRFDKMDESKYTADTFADTPALWYSGGIAWAADNKIVEGVGDNKFAPDTLISRQDMSKIMWKYIIYRGFQPGTIPREVLFADDSKIAEYAKDGVYGLKSVGLLEGKGSNLVEPNGNTTRAETSTMIYRIKQFAGDGYTAPVTK